MEFSSISKFLERFRVLARTRQEEREVVVGAIKRATGLTISPQQTTLRGKTMFINETPAKKAELFMRKKEILDQLQTEHSPLIRNISDIR